MDTGAIAIKTTTDANLPITQTQEVMKQINKLMYDHNYLRTKIAKIPHIKFLDVAPSG
jgi:hypothetical protein